jgi:tetratricopeptide (TPR) repeat protein
MAKRKAPRTPAAPRPPSASWLVAALAAAAVALYWGSLRNPRVFDDVALSARTLQYYANHGFVFDLRWFSYVTFGWIHEATGGSWFWQRLVNVLLHAAAGSVLFLLLRRLFGALGAGERSWPTWYAFFGACFFVAHPVAVYGVAYLIQRSIVMATLFGLLSLWLFLEGLLRGGRGWFLASVAAYFAAVFSKEHAVMLPAVAAAIAVLLRGAAPRNLPALAKELALPFVLYGSIAVLITLRSKGVIGTRYEPVVETVLRELAESSPQAERAEFWPLSALNQGFLFFRYLATWLLPWPAWMSIDMRTGFPTQLLGWPQTAGFAAWLAWPAFATALLLRRGRAGLAGLAMLAPWLLSLTEFATIRLQEPYVLYRSYLWMCLLPAALPALADRLQPRWRAALLIALCLALLPPFFDRLGSFASEIRVWDDAVQKLPEPKPLYASRAVRNRGIAYFRVERFTDALRDFDAALRLDPGNAASWIARGQLYLRTGESERALADFDRALALDADVPRRAIAYAQRCRLRASLGRLADALDDCLKAVGADPAAANGFISLGMVRASRGEAALAESAYRRALELEPSYGMARYQYGLLLRAQGRREEAREMLAAACTAHVPEACTEARSLGALP